MTRQSASDRVVFVCDTTRACLTDSLCGLSSRLAIGVVPGEAQVRGNGRLNFSQLENFVVEKVLFTKFVAGN